MMKKVVKSNSIINLLSAFNDVINDEDTRKMSGKRKQDFTRNRNMSFVDIIYYFISRCCSTSNEELSRYYSSMNKFNERISKQALNKAIKKLNPNVFNYLIKEFSSLFYKSDLVKTHKGYILLAEDGTTLEIPYSFKNVTHFDWIANQHVKEIFDVQKVTSKAGGLYDVTNGMFLDFTMHNCTCSETPIAFHHLYHTQEMLEGHEVIYLADRYYGSAEMISTLECFKYKYCIRGKSNFYKKQIKEMKSNDEWITINIDEKWLKRFRFSPDAKALRNKESNLSIRVIKYNYEYKNIQGKNELKEMLFFTNLSKEEFSTNEIIQLYAKRWDVEVSYKTTKSSLELERFISKDSDVAKCCIYGKLIFHNIAGIIRKEVNEKLFNKENCEKQYCVNINQLHHFLRGNNIIFCIRETKNNIIKNTIKKIIKLIDKIKVPIRPDRHNKRWGRVCLGPFKYRFSLDGRNFPKLARYNHVLITIKP